VKNRTEEKHKTRIAEDENRLISFKKETKTEK